MRIRTFYFILLSFLLILGGLVLFYASSAGSWHVYLIEGFIIIILAFSVIFYRRVIRPLRTIADGIDLLRAQDFSSRLIKVGQYETDRIIDVFNPLMDKLKNERIRLREQNYFLDLVLDASPMGVIVLDGMRRVCLSNPAARNILGQNIEGHTLDNIDNPVCSFLRMLSPGEHRTVRLASAEVYRLTHLSFLDKGYSHPFFLIEQLSVEVTSAEKAAYRKAIRMIVHEVNNTVGGITATLQAVSESEIAETDQPVKYAAEACMTRVNGMLGFIRRFADAAKIPEIDRKTLSVADMLGDNCPFLENICRKLNVSFHFTPIQSSEIFTAAIDPVLMEQVLVNIVKNAAESAALRPDGYVKLSVSTTDRTITITDNGTGIQPESAGKVFTPFFSTKPGGQGIGLIFVAEILSQHGFPFSLDTAADGLTRFTIGPVPET